MILYFAVQLRWFPASGMYALVRWRRLSDPLSHLVMPALALCRRHRGDSPLRHELRCWRFFGWISWPHRPGYVHLKTVILRHALRHAIVSILPVFGLQAVVLSGACILRSFFNGRVWDVCWWMQSLPETSYWSGGVLFVASYYVIFNIIVDCPVMA